MTSSNTLKRIFSIGAALLLAVGGSIASAAPSQAAAATSAPVIQGKAFAGQSLTATPAVWASGSASGKWYICAHGGSTAAATSVPQGCEALQVSGANTTALTTTLLTVPSIAYCASCTPFGNSAIGSDIRWIETNGSDTSASAAVVVYEGKSLSIGTITSGDSSVVLNVSGGCNFASPSIPVTSDWSISVGGIAATIANISAANNKITLSISSSMTTGQSVNVSYTQSGSSLLLCGVTGAVMNLASSNVTVVASGGGGGGGVSTTCAGQTAVTGYAASVATIAPGGTYITIWNNNPALNSCLLPTNGFASATFLNGTQVGQFYFSGTSIGLQVSNTPGSFTGLQIQAGRTLVTGDVIVRKIWVNPGNVQPSLNSPGDFSFTLTVTDADASATVVTPLSALQAKNVLKPLPTAVQPLVPALTAFSKPLSMAGGKIDAKAGDFTGLISATIAGKSLEFKLPTTGGISLVVPNGEAGKTADLLLTFSTGPIIFQDAIKYVAPVVVADVPVRPVAIAAGAKKLSEAASDSIRQAAFANLKNTNIQCIGYAANNSASAQAAARLTAVQACDVAIKANPDLKASDVVVVVDKTKAATAGVGIKVYK